MEQGYYDCVIRDTKGDVISRSHNERGIRRKCAKERAKVVAVDVIAGGEGKLMILFANGDSYENNWADFEVLRNAMRNWRSLYGAPLLMNGIECGKVSRDNPNLNPSSHPS